MKAGSSDQLRLERARHGDEERDRDRDDRREEQRLFVDRTEPRLAPVDRLCRVALAERRRAEQAHRVGEPERGEERETDAPERSARDLLVVGHDA